MLMTSTTLGIGDHFGKAEWQPEVLRCVPVWLTWVVARVNAQLVEKRRVLLMKKKYIRALVAGSLTSLTLLVACGGGGVNSGVDKGKSATELDDAETEQVCEAIVDYSADQADTITVEQTCAYAGLLAARAAYDANSDDDTIQYICKQLVKGCLAQTDDPGAGGADGNDGDNPFCDNAQVSDSCDVNVGQVEECSSFVIDSRVDAVKSAPVCDDITRDWLAAQKEPTRPASCDTVEAKCPELAAIMGL